MFINDCCETKTIAKIAKASLLTAYMEWCKKNNEYPQKRTTFYKNIESVPGVKSEVGAHNVKQFTGIDLMNLSNINSQIDYDSKF